MNTTTKNAVCTVEIEGHIIDSLTLPKVMDSILDMKGCYEIKEINIGINKNDASYAKLDIAATSEDELTAILDHITKQGVTLVQQEDVQYKECPKHKVLPDNFYLTTNLPTDIYLNNTWIAVENTAQDCVIKVDPSQKSAKCVKLNELSKGDFVVTGFKGIKVYPVRKHDKDQKIGFGTGKYSSEKPKTILIKQIAKRIKEIKKAENEHVMFILGPAVAHSKSQEAFSKIIDLGYVSSLFAGNAFAAHDIEASLFNTVNGISLSDGIEVKGGKANHLKAISTIYDQGSIAAAVEQGVLTKGILYTCVNKEVDFLLSGSIRDQGPLPEVITDTVLAQRTLREKLQSVKMVVMVAARHTALAVSNLIPANVETVCVDVDTTVITKLSERQSFQSLGIVTDSESFMTDLLESLSEGRE